MRRWFLKFGSTIAANLRRTRPRPSDHWHLDEMVIVSVANSYSRGDREFEKATAMLFPSKVAQRGRMRDHTPAPFRRRVTV